MLTIDNITVRRGKRKILSDISLTATAGQTLAVIGESGTGKSTLVASILGLLPLERGTVTWDGKPLAQGRAALVMQEPREAFNPALTLLRSVMEPLKARGLPLDPERLNRLCQELEIDPAILNRPPFGVSIGQAQRVGILRALIAAPPLVIFDEPLSALDAVTQKHTARLISALQKEEGFTALIVTHDLGYAAAHADQVAVLKSGRVEEAGPSGQFFQNPQSAYGKTLVSAALSLGALERRAA